MKAFESVLTALSLYVGTKYKTFIVGMSVGYSPIGKETMNFCWNRSPLGNFSYEQWTYDFFCDAPNMLKLFLSVPMSPWNTDHFNNFWLQHSKSQPGIPPE